MALEAHIMMHGGGGIRPTARVEAAKVAVDDAVLDDLRMKWSRSTARKSQLLV